MLKCYRYQELPHNVAFYGGEGGGHTWAARLRQLDSGRVNSLERMGNSLTTKRGGGSIPGQPDYGSWTLAG